MTSHHPHYAKASIAGHPIHAMLVGFPIAFYTGGVASIIAYAGTSDVFWYRIAMVLLFAGVIGALVAAVFGFGGIAAGATEIAKVLFFIFVVVFLVTLLLGLFRRT